jgi:hypothetical protein|tara:strand:- start:1398 stop:2075 length:678 start_codon:yes stop_codon:yes gene_type:complete
MDRRKHRSTFAFVDLLFNLTVGFVMLFIIAFILISPPTTEKKMDPDVQFVIKMTWPDKDKNDVDLWVRDPLGQKIGYRSREAGFTNLEKDDLGQSNDYAIINGERKIVYQNQEFVFIRGFISGQWRVNIHWYNKKDKETAEIPVLIELYDNKPNFKLLASQEVLLTKRGQQLTAFNFMMGEDGKIFDVNYEKANWILSGVVSFDHEALPLTSATVEETTATEAPP